MHPRATDAAPGNGGRVDRERNSPVRLRAKAHDKLPKGVAPTAGSSFVIDETFEPIPPGRVYPTWDKNGKSWQSKQSWTAAASSSAKLTATSRPRISDS